MKDGIILWTDRSFNYWVEGGEGRYPKTDFRRRTNWESYIRTCPIPALGVYGGQFKKSKFDYLIIKGIDVDAKGIPFFDYDFLTKGSTPSEQVMQAIQSASQRFFYTLTNHQLRTIIETLKEDAPSTWLNILGESTEPVEPRIPWKRFVGQLFLDLDLPALSNEDFEDTVARLLVALGFDVVQKGHKIQGEYPDGVAVFEGDFAIVYDCKNSVKYYPSAEHKRALQKYYGDEEIASDKSRKLFAAFIAKSFDVGTQKDVHLLSTESLVYLLYKRLLLGSRFRLNPIKKILVNNAPLSIDTINKEWPGDLQT
jgi:hypothetical protein